MDADNWFVTLGGECFEVEVKRQQTALPEKDGTYHHFSLNDVCHSRGVRLVTVFSSALLEVTTRGYSQRVKLVLINVIRRAFDSGVLSFDAPFDPNRYKQLEMCDSAFSHQPLVDDVRIRRFLTHKAYWLSYRHPTSPGIYPVDFQTPDDLEYLGATEADIRRNMARLADQGMLGKVMDRFGGPTEKLIAAYESEQDAITNHEALAIHGDVDVPTSQPVSHRGLSIFVSHSSKDEELALALVDLLKAGLGIRSGEIRCSSVDGHRLPVGVNTESQLREEVNAARVVVGLITPSSLSSYYVMFELGARWGSGLFLAPLLAGVTARDLEQPLSLVNSLSAHNESQLYQMVEDIATQMKVHPQSPAAYLRNIRIVKQLADTTQKQAEALSDENTKMKENQRFKSSVLRIKGHTYIEGDDDEICSRCADIDFRAVRLLDMNLDGTGFRATCPQCKTAIGHLAPPLSRKRLEEKLHGKP